VQAQFQKQHWVSVMFVEVLLAQHFGKSLEPSSSSLPALMAAFSAAGKPSRSTLHT
jgi:hypothetical protein